MLKSKESFLASITRSRDIAGLHQYLAANVAAPFPYDDLLRYQLVHVVSAFDKLIHDLIRVGMVQTFQGVRPATERYHAEPISISLHTQLLQASVPPKEVLFEQEIVRKMRYLSFQDPNRVIEGLSLVWNEKHKWNSICSRMGHNPETARTRMKLIVARRNSIVHEADIDPVSGEKTQIGGVDCSENTDFVEECGSAISDLLIGA